MPVVAVGLAVALDVGVASAAIAGTLTTLAAVTAIGATVSAVGAVTHNKTLSMIGMGIGIVGAIGTLASGAGLFDNVTDLFGSGSASGASGLAGDVAGAAGPLDTAGISATAADGLTSADAALSVASGGINGTAALSAVEGGMVPGPTASIVSQGQTASSLALPESAISTPVSATAGMSKIPAAGAASLDTATTTADSSGLMAWANKNPVMAFGAIQAGGSFISGLTNPVTPAQIDSLNSQAELNRAQAALIARQTANQGQALPVGTVASPAVTGTNNNGLINKVGTPLITGAPNTGATAQPSVTGVA